MEADTPQSTKGSGSITHCVNLQFAINTSKPPAPVALEGRLCQSAKPHEVKRSLVWLNLPPPAKLGIPTARVATALNLHFLNFFFIADTVFGFAFLLPLKYKKLDKISWDVLQICYSRRQGGEPTAGRLGTGGREL